MSKQEEEGYNGFTNYETWNVALWIGNDEFLYNEARRFRSRGYSELVEHLRALGITETPDKVSLLDSGLDRHELNQLLEDL